MLKKPTHFPYALTLTLGLLLCACNREPTQPSPTTQPTTDSHGGGGGWQTRLVLTKNNTEIESGRIEAGPCLAGDSLILADTHGTVWQLTLATGQTRWTFEAPDAIVGTPLYLPHTQTVYLADVVGNLIALDLQTGKQKWRVDTGAPIHAALSYLKDQSWLLAADDAGTLAAYDPTSGQKRWSAKVGARVNAAPAVKDQILYAGACDQKLYRVTLTDPPQTSSVKLPGIVAGSPVRFDWANQTRILVGTDRGHILCFDDQLQLLWDYAQIADQAMVYATPALYLPPANQSPPASLPTPPLALLVGTRDHQIHCLNPLTGQRNWVFPTAAEIDSPPLLLGTTAFIAGKDALLHALDISTGKELWRYRLQKPVVAPLATTKNAAGTTFLLIADEDATLYAIPIPTNLLPH